jgi:5-methylcytosine-specific restriction protein A
MSTYFLTWNPKRSIAEEEFEAAIADLKRGRVAKGHWSCGNNRSIVPGDRVFLLRQGSDHPGIVGSGWVTKGSFRARHWDPDKRKQGLKAWYVLFDWDALVVPEKGLPRSRLIRSVLPEALLYVQASGARIGEEFLTRLERRWADHRKARLSSAPLVLGSFSAKEGEPIEYRGYRRARDHRLKRTALDTAEGVCAVCSIDYSKILNGRGVRVLQVHHKRQLSQQDAPRLTHLSDLAVVCANCHALIHMNPKKTLPIRTLTRLLKESLTPAKKRRAYSRS